MENQIQYYGFYYESEEQRRNKMAKVMERINKVHVECGINVTYMSNESAAWYVGRYTSWHLMPQLCDEFIDQDRLCKRIELKVKNDILFKKQILEKYQMNNSSICLKDIKDEVDNIKNKNIQNIQNQNETDEVSANIISSSQNQNINDNVECHEIGNYKCLIKNTDKVTDEALIECEKVFCEYRNNVNTLELQLEQNKLHMQKSEVKIYAIKKTLATSQVSRCISSQQILSDSCISRNESIVQGEIDLNVKLINILMRKEIIESEILTCNTIVNDNNISQVLNTINRQFVRNDSDLSNCGMELCFANSVTNFSEICCIILIYAMRTDIGSDSLVGAQNNGIFSTTDKKIVQGYSYDDNG